MCSQVRKIATHGFRPVLPFACLGIFLFINDAPLPAAECFSIQSSNRPAIGGKEVDWIDGDYVLQNDLIVAVIANPVSGRDANMTVRGVGGCLIDLTRKDDMSDQLSAFYPQARKTNFTDQSLVETGTDESGTFWRCKSSDPDSTAYVEYRLRDGDAFLQITTGAKDEVPATDAVRADRSFEFGTMEVDGKPIAYFNDDFFRQCYGIVPVSPAVQSLSWDKQRMRGLTYESDGSSNRRTVRLYPANSLVDLVGLIRGGSAQRFQVQSAQGEHPRVQLTITSREQSSLAPLVVPKQTSLRVDPRGQATVHLVPGTYVVRASAIGHASVQTTLTTNTQAGKHQLTFVNATAIQAEILDESGDALPAKLTIYGVDGTPSPDFGPDSADGSVRNVVYTVDGSVTRSIPTGKYECLISHGPEYDVEVVRVSVQENKTTKIQAVLPRVVDTKGWVSAELHSHSSPSGDNTSSQRGRVENLVCEHLEFGPCTEHQRIDTYANELEDLGATHRMATCTGMELTGGPLPINHQNAFPLQWKPHQQNGGGPVTDSNPVTQIQRIAMWDDESKKVVQINHPDLNQMARDQDKDGKTDGGFASMFQFADVIEVHPPEAILDDPDNLSEEDRLDNRMFQWMRLIGEGQQIPGVVNTDAHYNWHGSGWLRNWVRSGTDNPAEIDIDEMTDSLETGRIIMSTGPFMTVQLHSGDLDSPAEIGDHVTLEHPTAELAVRVQCANWLDINRVEVFVNGRRVPELSRRRQTHPSAFADSVIKFDQRLPLTLNEDAFIIVAAIGENLTLGRVMGENFGNRPPIVVSNPIFVQRP